MSAQMLAAASKEIDSTGEYSWKKVRRRRRKKRCLLFVSRPPLAFHPSRRRVMVIC